MGKKLKNIFEYVLFVFFGWCIRLLPWVTVTAVGKAFGSFIFFVVPIRKRQTIENLTTAFPEKSSEEIRKIAHRCMQNICITLFEVFWHPRMKVEMLDKVVDLTPLPMIQKYFEQGKGLIFIGGHFANWELMSLAIGYHDQRQSTAIIKRQRNPYVNDFMRKMRTQFGGNVVEMDQAPREIFRGLRNNEVVAMLADQSAPKEGPYVTFFGRITATHPGPAVFCIRSGAPVVMPFLIRTSPGHYRLELRELDTSCPESLPADEKVKLLTQRHVSLLEEYIRKYPDHWLWQHRRWKHSPVGNE